MTASRPTFASPAVPGYVVQVLFATFAAATAGGLVLDIVSPSTDLALDPAAPVATRVLTLLTHGAPALVATISMLGLAVALPVFFFRAYKNVVSFDVGADTTPFWAAAIFWVPFFNIRRVYRNAQEIFRRSAGPDEIAVGSSVDVAAWWICWLIAGPAFRLSSMIGDALLVVSAIAGVRMIRTLVERQRVRAAAPVEPPASWDLANA